jgi:hypothetical protein
MLQASHPRIGLNDLKPLLQSSWQPLQIEALRYLSDDNDSARFPLLALAAADEKQSGGIRAEAIAGLADDAAAQADLLIKLAGSDNASVRAEALRSLRPAAPNLTKPQQEQVARTALKFPADADLVHRVLGRPVPERPAEIDIPAWQNIVDAAPGNPEAGRRIFFQHAGAGCYHCHMIEGRGRAVGPDLTMIGHSQTREHVLESILEPSKEIAPLYTLWSITTKSGQRIDGMLLRRDGQGLEVYVDATAQEIKVPEPTITDRKMRKESLMPTGLAQGMTDQELRDLMALLMQKR